MDVPSQFYRLGGIVLQQERDDSVVLFGLGLAGAYLCAMLSAKDDLQVRWLQLRIKLRERFAIKPELDGILFLIGVQELGAGHQEYTKEQKQDLMHIAVCTVLSASGYYALQGYDEEGWPHFQQLKPLPSFNLIEQENFLKDHILLYFQQFEWNQS